MAAVGIDVSDRTPGYVDDLERLAESDYLVTMGCSISKFNPARYGVESRSWDLTNPDGADVEAVDAVRDEIEDRVRALFDEIEAAAEAERAVTESGGVVAAIRKALSR